MTCIKIKLKSFFSGRNIYLIISVAVFAVLMLLGTVTLGPRLIETAKDPEKFREFIGNNRITGVLIFLGIQFLQVVFAFIPGEFIEIGAGYAFGGIIGTILCLVGSALATMLIFGLTRLLGRKFTSIMIDQRDLKRLKFLNDDKKLVGLMALLYLIPGTPKDLITYFAGVTKIKFGTFMIISTFCRIPSVVTSTFAGSTFGQQKYLSTAIIFTVAAILGITGYFIYNLLSRKHSERKQKDNNKKS